MKFCDDCGTLVPADQKVGECQQCGALLNRSGAGVTQTDGGTASSASSTELENLPTTSSGSIKKKHAMEWLENRERPSGAELRRAVMEKPSDFSGSTFPTDISTIRLTGDPQFIETIAGLFT